MKKKSLLLSLSVLAVTIAVTVASTPPANTAVIPAELSSEEIVITPFAVDKEFTDTASGGATVVRTFGINADYGHLKLNMKNYSNKPVTVNLEHINTGLQYFSITITAGVTETWKNLDEGYPQGMRIGDYKLTWSGGSSSVNGEYWGKLHH